MNLRELIDAYANAERGAPAEALLAELDRRIALAEADNQIMWHSHLNETATSISRQRALLRNADLDEARGWGRPTAEQYVRADLVEEYRAAKEVNTS